MQTEGGYKYPSNQILIVLSAVSICVSGIVWYIKCLSLLQLFTLLMGMEGTSLLASAYTPTGLETPQGSLWKRIKWFFKPQKGTQASFDQRMFYGGLLCIFLSFIATFAA